MAMPAIRGSLYIDGQWCEADDGATRTLVNPATEEPIGEIASCGGAEVRRAIDAAHQAGPAWAKLTPYERQTKLRRVAELIRERVEEIAQCLTLEQGKPIVEARLEVLANATFFEWYADEGTRVYGEMVPHTHPDKRLFVFHQPVGVSMMISPWNFPLFLQGRKIAPALAAGCTCICRPSSETPLNLIKFFEILEDAGIPAGVANLVTGPAGTTMEPIYDDTRVRQISFSGSTEVGKEIMRRAADHAKRIGIELGGHAPFIATPDFGAVEAARFAAASKFRNAGQSCVSASRFYIQRDMVEEFTRAVVDIARSIVIGDGRDEETQMGPLCTAGHRDKTESLIADAVAKGATVLTGGKRPKEFERGYFYRPTVLSDITPDMELMIDEPFCPIMPIIPYDTLDEALELANATEYGLAGYIATRDTSTAIRLAEGLDACIISVGDFSPATVLAPFGGMKQSGIGREGGREGILEYLEAKYVSLKID